jgi:plastocyanin
MNTTTTSPRMSLSERLPVTALGKVICGIALFLALGALVGGFFTGSIALYTVSAVNLLVAILIGAGFRWAPIPGAVITGGGVLYTLFGNPYPIYHLSHPKSDPLFAVLVIVVGLSVLTFAANIAVIAQNYWTPDRQLPRWFSLVLTGVIGAVIGALLMGVIVQPGTANTTTVASDGAIIVHLGESSFSASAITVPQGGKIQFVADSSITHILTYGDWSGNHPQPSTPANVPALNNREISGGSFELGPFATAGTYHIMCTVHPGMMLTVTVP